MSKRLAKIMEHQDDEELCLSGDDDFVPNLTAEEWEEIGRNASNNPILNYISIIEGALDDRNMTNFFRGLTGSSSIEQLHLEDNSFSFVGVRSMVPFLKNATKLTRLELIGSKIQSEGFSMFLGALRDSPIELLRCNDCDIGSIDHDIEYLHTLEYLELSDNNINADGCQEIATLLQRRGSALKHLRLMNNKIDDKGVAVLVDALRNNSSLESLYLLGNDDISRKGRHMLLKLVNDISSIKATLQSNHTLNRVALHGRQDDDKSDLLDDLLCLNADYGSNPEIAGKEKVIQIQLYSASREQLAKSQGIHRSVYSEINPLHLPEVLTLISRRHGLGELYVALKSSIAQVMSTANKEQCIEEKILYYEGKLEKLRADLVAIKSAKGDTVEAESDDVSHKNKRRRKWWWGLWG